MLLSLTSCCSIVVATDGLLLQRRAVVMVCLLRMEPVVVVVRRFCGRWIKSAGAQSVSVSGFGIPSSINRQRVKNAYCVSRVRRGINLSNMEASRVYNDSLERVEARSRRLSAEQSFTILQPPARTTCNDARTEPSGLLCFPRMAPARLKNRLDVSYSSTEGR